MNNLSPSPEIRGQYTESGSYQSVDPLATNTAPSVSREEALGRSTGKRASVKVEQEKSMLQKIEDGARNLFRFFGEKIGQVAKTVYDLSPVGLIHKGIEKIGLENIKNFLIVAGKVIGSIVTSKEFWIGVALTLASVAVPAFGIALLGVTALQAGVALASGDFVTAAICVACLIPGLRGAKGAMMGLKEGFKAGVKAAAPQLANRAYLQAGRSFVKELAQSGGVLSQTAKNAVTGCTKQLAKNLDDYLATKLSDEAILASCQSAGKSSGEKAAQVLAKNADLLAREGLESQAGKSVMAQIKNVSSNETERSIEALLKSAKVDEFIKKQVAELLKHGEKGSRQMVKILQTQGFSKSEAKELAKQFSQSIRTACELPAARGALEEEITDILTKRVIQNLQSRSLKLASGETVTVREAFGKSFDEQIDQLVKNNPGKYSDEVIAGAKSAGREGFDDGLRLGVRKVVSAGVKAGFRAHFKKSFLGPVDSPANKRKDVLTGPHGELVFKREFEEAPRLARIETSKEAGDPRYVAKDVYGQVLTNKERVDEGVSKLVSIFVKKTRLDGVRVDGEDNTSLVWNGGESVSGTSSMGTKTHGAQVSHQTRERVFEIIEGTPKKTTQKVA